MRAARVEFFIKEVSDKIKLTMKQRMGIVLGLLQSTIVSNLSKPVTKGTGPRGGRVVINRSVPGEFPRADTTQLLKDIFTVIRPFATFVEGHVGTTLDYGLRLEIEMDRSFLVRTFNELRGPMVRILTGPIK